MAGCCGRFDMVAILYAISAVGIGVYMVAALVRPDKF
jgi:hypothetical protein